MSTSLDESRFVSAIAASGPDAFPNVARPTVEPPSVLARLFAKTGPTLDALSDTEAEIAAERWEEEKDRSPEMARGFAGILAKGGWFLRLPPAAGQEPKVMGVNSAASASEAGSEAPTGLANDTTTAPRAPSNNAFRIVEPAERQCRRCRGSFPTARMVYLSDGWYCRSGACEAKPGPVFMCKTNGGGPSDEEMAVIVGARVEVKCRACGGTGAVEEVEEHATYGPQVTRMDCGRCGGTGKTTRKRRSDSGRKRTNTTNTQNAEVATDPGAPGSGLDASSGRQPALPESGGENPQATHASGADAAETAVDAVEAPVISAPAAPSGLPVVAAGAPKVSTPVTAGREANAHGMPLVEVKGDNCRERERLLLDQANENQHPNTTPAVRVTDAPASVLEGGVAGNAPPIHAEPASGPAPGRCASLENDEARGGQDEAEPPLLFTPGAGISTTGAVHGANDVLRQLVSVDTQHGNGDSPGEDGRRAKGDHGGEPPKAAGRDDVRRGAALPAWPVAEDGRGNALPAPVASVADDTSAAAAGRGGDLSCKWCKSEASSFAKLTDGAGGGFICDRCTRGLSDVPPVSPAPTALAPAPVVGTGEATNHALGGNWMPGVVGQWPGAETEEQLLKGLTSQAQAGSAAVPVDLGGCDPELRAVEAGMCEAEAPCGGLTGDAARFAMDLKRVVIPWDANDRAAGIGGSEIYTAVNDPMRLYCEKRGITAPFEDTDATEAGRFLENGIAEWFAYRTGLKVRGNGRLVVRHPDEPWIFASPDRFVYGEATVCCNQPDRDRDGEASCCGMPERDPDALLGGLEIKNVTEWKRSEWGEAADYDLPEPYYYQVQWCMGVTGLRKWWICPLIGGNKPRFDHVIDFDPAFFDGLVKIARAFWFGCVVPGEAPAITASESSREYLKAQYRKPKTDALVEPADPETAIKYATQYLDATERLKPLEEAKKEAQYKLQDMIGRSGGTGLLLADNWPCSWRPRADGVRVFNLKRGKS